MSIMLPAEVLEAEYSRYIRKLSLVRIPGDGMGTLIGQLLLTN